MKMTLAQVLNVVNESEFRVIIKLGEGRMDDVLVDQDMSVWQRLEKERRLEDAADAEVERIGLSSFGMLMIECVLGE